MCRNYVAAVHVSLFFCQCFDLVKTSSPISDSHVGTQYAPSVSTSTCIIAKALAWGSIASGASSVRHASPDRQCYPGTGRSMSTEWLVKEAFKFPSERHLCGPFLLIGYLEGICWVLCPECSMSVHGRFVYPYFLYKVLFDIVSYIDNSSLLW